MPGHTAGDIGRRIATARRARRMTQAELGHASYVSYHTIRSIERGARMPSDDTLDSIAAALHTDPSRLLGGYRPTRPVHDALPALSEAIAAYDVPDDGPVRPLAELRVAVDEVVGWRLAAQYLRIATALPPLLAELLRALDIAAPGDRPAVARMLVAAFRAADAVAYKNGARDLSARLIELMRWAATPAEDPLILAGVAYVRTETFFAARAHAAGLRALQHAIDAAPSPDAPAAAAAVGALHMRAAVIAGRAGDGAAADAHLTEAHRLGDSVAEGTYSGTAFGPCSVRIHEVSVAVSLGSEHSGRALDVAREWKPGSEVPAERRSGFYIELARAQLWAGLRDDAFESLKVARRIAPQHAREHPWAREDAATLRRLARSDNESLTSFAEWVGAV
ncbi:helix-turn-helix domain-containing protein [Streptomyces sp. NPDC088732]|uniref:helix-turn-helix domain-containing protein n=1 Tax=Streptomyces sp. NPDC088732 TaxID=3365879 RepID=UPI0037F8C872